MERIKDRWKNLSLKKAFIVTVLVTVGVIALLSLATILFCLWGRHALLPDARTAYLTIKTEYEDHTTVTHVLSVDLDAEEQRILGGIGFADSGEDEGYGEGVTKYNITKADSGYSYLTPKKKLVYRCLGAGMVIVPAVYTILGIFFSAVWFYRHKLSVPIRRLEYAIGQIKKQDLEFSLEAPGEDELGRVCSSFEEMRKIVYHNNQSLWNMLEERKQLQASVAHDLRNPITIIRTYTEYLKLNLAGGTLSGDQMDNIIDNLQLTAKRMEQYTDSIRDIGRIEELELHPVPVDLAEVIPELEEELGFLAEREHKRLAVNYNGELKGTLDVTALCRILENLVANAARYAKKTIWMEWTEWEYGIQIRVADDGPGYPGKVLTGTNKYFTTAEEKDGHMGMGLAICRILCRKLGGRLELSNPEGGGAEAVIFLKT